jgi:hypothetical protein
LFRTEMITARVTPDLFKSPHVWANLDEVTPIVRRTLAELLTAPSPAR